MKSLANKTVRKSASEVPRATAADLERLRAAMNGRIDTQEIPERRSFQRLHRDGSGRLPPRKSMIRDAVERQMRRLHLSVYRLWQIARQHYPLLSQSAIHEFLRGHRQLELPSVEALLAAVNLRVVTNNGRRRRKLRQAANQSKKTTFSR